MAERGRPRSFDRDAALRQALELFWAKGYDGASLTDLTRAMGINAPSLYAAFGCKEALFREAAALYAATDGAVGARILEESPTARGAVDGLLRAMVANCKTEGPTVGCFIALCSPDATPENAALRRDLSALRLLRVREIRDRLARGVADGELPKTADLDAMATFYATILQGISLQARDGLDCIALDSLVTSAMAAWEPLVAAPARRRAATATAGAASASASTSTSTSSARAKAAKPRTRPRAR